MDDISVGKVTISVTLRKINFPKISEQAPLRQTQHYLRFFKKLLDILHT